MIRPARAHRRRLLGRTEGGLQRGYWPAAAELATQLAVGNLYSDAGQKKRVGGYDADEMLGVFDVGDRSIRTLEVVDDLDSHLLPMRLQHPLTIQAYGGPRAVGFLEWHRCLQILPKSDLSPRRV